uniref:Short-chain dehydrogenase/reductase family 16C member 6 n=1 Tax=Steinernema glaseri TaxID=37863 RepID=A0A1I8AB68_9BILA
MGRETLGKRIIMTVCFVFRYLYCLVCRDFPRIVTMKRKDVSGQVVVITGGAMGIGKGLSLKFANELHAKVCILDINEKVGHETRDEILAAGGEAYFFPCNVADPDSVRLCAQQIYSNPHLGTVDILVCNAAVLRMGEFTEMSDNDFKVNNDVNILGYIYSIRGFIRKMMEANKGQIVCVGSICSHYGEQFGTAYCTAKFAIRGLMEALQCELLEKGKNGVVTTMIYPYFTQTTLVTENMKEPFSTHLDVVPIDECVEEMTDAILKERMYYFIPWHLTFFCTFAKCLTTKSILPYARKFFNFRYEPIKRSTAQSG